MWPPLPPVFHAKARFRRFGFFDKKSPASPNDFERKPRLMCEMIMRSKHAFKEVMHMEQARAPMDREARFAGLMAMHRTWLVRLAYLYLGDLALAEDAVQDTFLKAWTHWEEFRADSSEKTWLTRIAINTCKDIRRTAWFRRARQALSLEVADHTRAPDPYRDDSVIQAIRRLPDRDRQVILLRYYQELSVRETAQVLGISESSAASRIHRAKDRLREALKGWWFNDED